LWGSPPGGTRTHQRQSAVCARRLISIRDTPYRAAAAVTDGNTPTGVANCREAGWSAPVPPLAEHHIDVFLRIVHVLTGGNHDQLRSPNKAEIHGRRDNNSHEYGYILVFGNCLFAGLRVLRVCYEVEHPQNPIFTPQLSRERLHPRARVANFGIWKTRE